MARPRHPEREIEEAVAYAESHGWEFIRPGSHAWGILCNTTPRLREPIRDPARLEWVKVTKVAHYRIDTRSLS